jgi:flagellar biosynthesis/type III secretory pathway protein FliH
METRGAVDEHPERAAVEQYQEQLTERRMLAASDTAVVEQAEAKGYEDGFKQGQERALEAAQEAVRPHADLLSKVIEDLESKKKKVLENAQQNFNILTETLITSLLKREFKVNPESLAGVIQRAIQETVSDDQFSVEINPLTLAALMPLVDDRTKMKLNSNDQIPEGEFRIETKLAVVEGKINQIVKDLLDQADLSLFDTTEKAV